MTEREDQLVAQLARFVNFCPRCGGSGYRYVYGYSGLPGGSTVGRFTEATRRPCDMCSEARELLAPAALPELAGVE